jgi:hypothetical protein
MRIGVAGSMHSSEEMLQVWANLCNMSHDAFTTSLIIPFIGKTPEEKERLKIDQKMNQDAIRDFWRLMQGADALLVLNLRRHGIANYIGGNTFLEMGFAHVLNQKIFLWNPIPEMGYRTEIEAMRPIVIDKDLTKIQ